MSMSKMPCNFQTNLDNLGNGRLRLQRVRDKGCLVF